MSRELSSLIFLGISKKKFVKNFINHEFSRKSQNERKKARSKLPLLPKFARKENES